MLLTLIIFVILMVLGREELGWKGVLIWSLSVLGLLALSVSLGWPGVLFCAILAIVDAVLVVMIFGGDITIG